MKYMKVDGQLWSELEVELHNLQNSKKFKFIENGEIWVTKLPPMKKAYKLKNLEDLKEPAIKVLNYEFKVLSGLEIKVLTYMRNHCLDKNSANFRLHTKFKDIEKKLNINHRTFLRILNSLERKRLMLFETDRNGKRDLKTVSFLKVRYYEDVNFETFISSIEDIVDYEDGFTYIPEKYYFEDLTGTEFKTKALLVKYNNLGKFVGKKWRSCFAGFAKLINKSVSSVWKIIKHIEEKLLIRVERYKKDLDYKTWYTNFILV